MKKRRPKLITRFFSVFLALCMVLGNTGFLSLASSLDTGENLVTILIIQARLLCILPI